MNETRITAYALNELLGGERDQFESDLASDQKLQSELASASRVADGLAQVMSEPGEGLEPQARRNLLRAIAENQQAFRQRRKIVRFAVPFSLAAAASIAVLLWVAGGMTAQGPAVAAASAEDSPAGAAETSAKDGSMVVIGGESGGFSARLDSKGQVFTFKGTGSLSSPSDYDALQTESEAGQQTGFALSGLRTVQTREGASSTGQAVPFDQTEIRVRGLRWESPQTFGLGGEHAGHTDFLTP